MKSLQKGFTLIELMIVIAIIAILAAIAVPMYQNYLIRAQVSEGMSLSGGVKAGMETFYSARGHYPKTAASAGVAQAGSITGSYVSSVAIKGKVIEITYDGPKSNDKIRTAQGHSNLILSPVTHAGSISWTCNPTSVSPTTGYVETKYLPTSCR